MELFWPGLFTKALASVNIRSLICNVKVGGPALAADASPAEGPAPTTAAAAEKEGEAKKQESEESDDNMGSRLFLTKSVFLQ